jgi:hypothetical protein
MKSIDEDVGIEKDNQLYLFKKYFERYDWEVVFPIIYYHMFDWMNYIGEPES